ncbi:MAG: glucoamylase family protein [Chitinophagales bacterium]
MKIMFLLFAVIGFLNGCKKSENNLNPPNPSAPGPFKFIGATVDGTTSASFIFYNVGKKPIAKLSFSSPIDKGTASDHVFLTENNSGTGVPINFSYDNNDSVLVVQPISALQPITYYTLKVDTSLHSSDNVSLASTAQLYLTTTIDSTDKFPQVPDSALLDLVEQQTFKYFWDFGHPVSGLARERNSSGDVVTIGGSGFGVMAILTGISRNFVSRSQGLNRISQIVSFLSNSAQRYHGAFPHWLNGSTGATIPFSSQDDGADLVETSYLMEGLLCARQYFSNASDSTEINLRNAINQLWNGIEWSWFRQGGQNVLYWHWSPDFGFAINMQIKGWNEAMIVYALAASSNTDTIPKIVYDNGWAGNGSMRNGNTYYGIQLLLGPPLGGPLFFAHYSFLGINPTNLQDAFANYWTQNTNHAKINFSYCVANPKSFNGYSSSCWGLTASDDNNGYSAHAPDNDDGVISPTAAISSLPYTPTESMNTLRFFYYKLGDKIWGQYGFIDAFNLSNIWFSNSWLAIDQGPEIIMIENYRTGLLWNLFMSCPEIKRGMSDLGFQSPNLN